jgi:hypothetical protein
MVLHFLYNLGYAFSLQLLGSLNRRILLHVPSAVNEGDIISNTLIQPFFSTGKKRIQIQRTPQNKRHKPHNIVPMVLYKHQNNCGPNIPT